MKKTEKILRTVEPDYRQLSKNEDLFQTLLSIKTKYTPIYVHYSSLSLGFIICIYI